MTDQTVTTTTHKQTQINAQVLSFLEKLLGEFGPLVRAELEQRTAIACCEDEYYEALFLDEADDIARYLVRVIDRFRPEIQNVASNVLDIEHMLDMVERDARHTAPVVDLTFQHRVDAWVVKCFGEKLRDDKVERRVRFLEEALELTQSVGMSKEEALRLVDYVYSRDKGEPEQEVGGVATTLCALCTAHDISVIQASAKELHRIQGLVEQIRDKQKKKPVLGE